MSPTTLRCFRTVAAGVAVALGAALPVVATGAPAFATVALSGSGTVVDPYLIGSASDLDAAAVMVNADSAHSGAAKADYALTADVDYAGGAFADFTWFGGTFDGAGHTISNLSTSGTSGSVAPFVTVTGTIENLTFDHLTVSGTRDTSVAGVTTALNAPGRITGVAIVDSSIVASTAGAGTGNQAGGLAANTTGAVTIRDNVVWNTTIQGWKYSAGIATYARVGGVYADNLINASVKSAGSGGGGNAGGIFAQNNGAITVTGNVVYGGSVSGTGQDTAGAIGPVVATYDSTTDLVSTGVVITPGATGSHTNNGTATDPAALGEKGTYADLGWDFTGGTTPWTWDESAHRPVLRSAPLLQLTDATALFYAAGAAAPSQAEVLAAVAHRIDQGTGQATFAADLTGVDFTTAGTYTATITASDNGQDATPRPITIGIVAPPVITLANPSVDYTVGDTITAADVIARSGARVASSSAEITADLTSVDASTEGTYAVALTATDHGFTGDPVTVSVVVAPAGSAIIHVAHTSVGFVLGDDITAATVIAAAGATLNVDGTIAVDLSGVDTAHAGTYPARLTATGASSVTVTVVIDPVPTPVITVTRPTVTFPIGTAPTPADVLTALGASIDHGDLAIDLSGVDFTTANSYSVTVAGSFRGVDATAVPATIKVVLPGSGTAADPYLIGSAKDLDTAAAMANADVTHTAAAKADYALTADIDYAGGTFDDFTWFGGTFDGAGHTISNIVYSNTSVGSGGSTGLFITLTGTVQDLTLAHVTSDALNAHSSGGVASSVNLGTIQRVAVVDSTVSIGGGAVNNSQAGGLAGGSTGASTFTDNMVWNVAVTGDKYGAGLVTYARTGAVITDNLVNAKVISPNSGGGSTAGMILAQNNGAITVTGNVVFGGSASGSAATHAGVGPATANYSSTTDLVSSAVSLMASSVAGDNGLATDEATLAQQETYADLGWDLTAGSGPWSWVDAGAASHPILSFLAVDVPAPLVRFTHPAILVSTQIAQPSDEQLLADFGARADHGTLSITLGDPTDAGVNFQSPGSYQVTVTGTDHGVFSQVPATIVITPLPGAGTEDDPLRIGSVADLDTAVSAINSGPAVYAAAHYELTADINYAGHGFVGIDRFSGVFDGAGHTISNLTYTANTTPIANAEVLAFFRVLDGATVENLSLNDVEASGGEDVAGLVDDAYASTIVGDSMISATLTSTNGDVAGLVGGTVYSDTYAHATGSSPNLSDDHTSTVADNAVLDSTMSGRWLVGGVVAAAKGTVLIARNLVDVDVVNTAVVVPGTGVSAGEVLGAVGSNNTGGTTDNLVRVSDNVVLGGSVTTASGGTRTGFDGYVIGGLENAAGFTNWTATDNLVSPAATLGSSLTGGPATFPGQGGQDGTASTSGALAQQSTYAGLGWDFDRPTWAWDATDERPHLAGVPELQVPTLTLGRTTVAYQVGTAPGVAQLLADLGATVSPAGDAALQLGGAKLTEVGSYDVTVTGDDHGVGSRTIAATVNIVPVITISTAVTHVEYATGSSVDAQQLLADVGAATSTPGTLDADLSEVDLSTAASYSVSLSAVDGYGFPAAPVTVTVVVTDAATTDPPTETPALTPGTVTISGTPQVGTELTAAPGTWSPAGTPSYRWLRDGSAIPGATDATYTLDAADAGLLLQVEVTERHTGYVATSALSEAITVAAGAFTANIPAITGTAAVGQTLTADPGTWSPAPSATAYRWLRDGIPIAGATAATYTLDVADWGHDISVSVNGVRDGFTSLGLASPTVTVGAGTLAAGRPTVSGASMVGVELTAVTGAWSPMPSRLTYQWLRDGGAIPGATAATYTPSAADWNARLSVRVTAEVTGYTTTSATSDETVVAPGTLSHPGRLKITGVAKAGKKVRVQAGAWSPEPALSFQWFAAGKKIRGATKHVYKIAPKYEGKRLTVKVTGNLPGYLQATVTSAQTKAVAK